MVHLDNIRSGEKVEIVVRRHWIVFWLVWLYALIWVLISFSILMFLNTAWAHILNIVFWMFFAIFLYIEWLNHELDMFVITNNRIVWVEQKSFLNRWVTECNLGQVQEVNSITKWLLANIFNYGTISIQTAWNMTNLEMTFAPVPLNTSRSILNIVDKYRDKHSFKQKEWAGLT